MKTKEEDKSALDENQKKYRAHFEIVDKYLIGLDCDLTCENPNGYIVFIDYQNDLDYIDNREDLSEEEKKKQLVAISKLQKAEAVPSKHLPVSHQMEFKRMLGVGYIHALNGQYDEIDQIIDDASRYIKRRNREYSRELFLKSGIPAAAIAALVGFLMYYFDCRNPWYYGLVFGILGSYVSIWTRYGKVQFTGHAKDTLHILECYSRMLIGSIFAVISMIAIKCELILPQIAEKELIYAFSIASFIAAFSERFIPSIIERITKDDNGTKA